MKRGFLIIVVLQAFLLVSIIGYRQYWVENGKRIVLKTSPVDPRDIFRGDYVRLGYEISSLDLGKLGAKEDFRRNEKVFVLLEQRKDGIFQPVGISVKEPDRGYFIQGRALGPPITVSAWQVTVRDDKGQTQVLRPPWFSYQKGDRLSFCLNSNGAVMSLDRAHNNSSCWHGNWHRQEGIVTEIREEKTRRLLVEYGIESYFVEEGKGKAIETARNASDLKVEVSLRKDGKGIITGLFMDGKLVR